MWSEPYLETCCRAALHRLFLSGTAGRPEADAAMKDVPCLARLVQLGCVEHRGGRFFLTAAGAARHAAEILRARG
ncbi:hypothetical protein [Acidibrevibacterium fodinaquatile]|uniref:hypothetical protein n=1 Tax=Acidibrevibacterium fodinaquatile TaxID=1969806 RepID=UPI000E0CC52F|nr:hypothetical protein [Acidibrevibacterium fodinaquatile]